MDVLRELFRNGDGYCLQILNALPVAIYATDAAGRITYCNDAAADFAGKRPILFSDEWCVTWRLFRPDGTPLPHADCPMAIALKEGRTISGEEAIAERPDGTRVYFRAYPTPLFNAAGRLIGGVNLLLDVSEQKRAEAEADRMRALLERRVEHRTKALVQTVDRLKKTERSFQMLVESVTDYAIFMLDLKGRVSSWNAGAERIKGYARAEIVGEHFSRFYTEEDKRAGIPQKILVTVRSEGRFEQEGWRVRKDGSRFWAHVVIDAVRNGRGQHVGFAKVVRDMTDRRAIEERLRQSQKMDALGQLTGGVAHDFNNLLTVILSGLEVLSRSLTGPPPAQPSSRVLRAIGATRDASTRAAALTQRLLAFSRKQALQPQTIDLGRLIDRVSELLRRTLGERVTIKTNIGFDTGLVSADPAELENALSNLAVNARDAMPTGGTITIETASVDGPELRVKLGNGSHQKYAIIVVKDDGIGMDQETLAKAFDPFFTTKDVGHGTGLGLSQVYGFVKQSGGHVLIYSEPGAGTFVGIYLPQLPSDAHALEPEEESADKGISRGSETILVVEDNDEVRASSTDTLREQGYRVLEAPNATAAFEILGRQPEVHLLFTDIGLPGNVSGRQLSDTVREHRPELKVLLTTGYTADPVVRTGRLEPGVSLLRKPFSGSDLTKRIREVLDS